MSKKNNNGGLIYSTNKSLAFNTTEKESTETLPPSKQKLRVMIDKKNRAGKTVTLVTGFIGNSPDLETLAKRIKNFCGTGGSVKDMKIIIQGDLKQKVYDFLLKEGYSVKM